MAKNYGNNYGNNNGNNYGNNNGNNYGNNDGNNYGNNYSSGHLSVTHDHKCPKFLWGDNKKNT